MINKDENGLRQGLCRLEGINSTFYVKGEYVNDKKHGKWCTYLKKDDSIFLIEHYKYGILNGSSLTYLDGNLIKERTFVNGLLHGIHKTYGVRGKPVFSGKYKEGKKEGYWYRYHEDLSLNGVSHYVNNQKQGLQINFYLNNREYIF